MLPVSIVFASISISAAGRRLDRDPSAVLAKLLKKHKADPLIAVIVPEPLASVIRNVVRHDGWGDLWQSVTETPRWQVIDLPEAAAAK